METMDPKNNHFEYLPETLILVRHGESTHNALVRKMREEGFESVKPNLRNAHESAARLTEKGVQQALKAGEWFEQSRIQPDYFCVSPYARAKQTAAYLALKPFPQAIWSVDHRLRERDWGFSSLDPADLANQRKSQENYFMWRPTMEAESFSDCQVRAQQFIDHFKRHPEGKTAICVSHGEYIMAMMGLLEKLDIDTFNTRFNMYSLPNAAIVIYTRKSPQTGELFPFFRFRQVICPWDSTKSWDNEQLTEFLRPKYGNQGLLNSIKTTDPYAGLI
jgi:broad specificity phosphatase PhoE